MARPALPAVMLLAALTAPAAADRALVVGIDRYADGRLSLPGASSVNDAGAIAALLTDSLGYDDADIRVLTDEAATRAAIADGFDQWLVDGTGPGDRVFFYFSGQGYFAADDDGDERDGIAETLRPHDAIVGAGDDPAVTNVIADDELVAMLNRLDGRKVTVAIDAGHSGLVAVDPASETATAGVRAAAPGVKTRAIVVEPRVKAQKAEGAPIETAGLGADVAVFSAASGAQAPLIADGGGTFTKAFVDSIRDKGADANHNGVVSNAEILAFVRQKSQAACADSAGCDIGLTPTLGPAAAAGGSPAGNADSSGVLTTDRILDFFAKGNGEEVVLEQVPPSPVKVGTEDIRFRVVSPVEGNLVLLDLGDDGTLVQLFPNEHTRDRLREGHILAGSPITVPDDYYGIKFNATSPTKGTLIALVTTEPIALPETVKTRKIEVIPRQEATEVFLPAIAAALDKPADTAADTATRAIDWSVATLRYEIVK
jgi:hypothetical protein